MTETNSLPDVGDFITGGVMVYGHIYRLARLKADFNTSKVYFQFKDGTSLKGFTYLF